MERRKPTLSQLVVWTALLGSATWYLRPVPGAPDYRTQLYYGLLALTVFAFFPLVGRSIRALRNHHSRQQHLKHSTQAGSADWLSTRDIKKAGLNNAGLPEFLGMKGGTPIFYRNETHTLTLAPAGAGKTVCAVMPQLCHNPTPMLVTDLKGTLACMTADLRRRQYGHTIRILNPADLWGDRLPEADSYNPLQIVKDDLLYSPADAISDARTIALQLHPEPTEPGANRFFRDGTRKLLTFAILWLCLQDEEDAGTLADALTLLSTAEAMDEALMLASESDALYGDLSDLAIDIAELAHGPNSKIYEDFRQGAVLSLAPFSRSGRLAESTAACTFRFSDLKQQQATVYILADPTRQAVYAPWVGLIAWAAITEITRCLNNRPVKFLFDEASNFRVDALPSMLTGLREFGVSVHMIFQELEEIARVYGRPALETVLSQTAVKQFFGVSSQKTAQHVSQLLGTRTVAQQNIRVGMSPFEDTKTTASAGSRALMTPDELRRLPDDEQIIFLGNLKPIRAKKIGYHQVRPWSRLAGHNPLFGGGRYEEKPKIRLHYPKSR